jgi:hypothetical protein
MFKGYRVSREIEYLDQSQSESQRGRGRPGGEEKKKLNFELRRESTSRGKWGCSKKANVGRCSQPDDLSRLREWRTGPRLQGTTRAASAIVQGLKSG